MELSSTQLAIQSEIQSFVSREIIPKASEFDAQGALSPISFPNWPKWDTWAHYFPKHMAAGK